MEISYWPILTFLWFLSLNLASGVSSDDFEFVPTAQKMTAVRAKVKGESRLKSGKLPRILHQGCYHLLSPGRKLTNSQANFQLDLIASCQDKCDSSEDFECIAYSFGYSEEDVDSKGQCDLLAYSSDPLKQSMETLADPKYNIYQKDGSCDDLNNLNLNSEMPRSRELKGKIANDPPPPYSRPQFSGFLGNSFFHVQNLKPQYSSNQKIDGGFFNTAASLLVGEACFHQSVIGRRLASPFIAKSWTAYSLKECEQFCVSEKGFTCRGFAYREIEQDEQKVQNCDLSQKNTSDLDPYNEQHFLQHPVTDFYEIKVKDNCFDIAGQDKIDINDVEILSSSYPDYSDNWPQATFLQPQSGEDAVVIIQKTSSECFDRVRSGYKHFTYRNSKSVSHLQACAEECMLMGNCFTFSFRHNYNLFSATPLIQTSPNRATAAINCVLSDATTALLKETDLVRSSNQDEWDLYELSNSANCISQASNSLQTTGISNNLQRGSCHLRDRVGYKHRFQDITQSSNVQDLIECSERCQRLSFCRSFSFKYAGGFNSESNCLLSSIRIEDVDYVSDQDWDLYEIQQLCRRNNQDNGGLTQQQTLQDCHLKQENGYKHYVSAVRDTFSVRSLSECSRLCHQSSSYCQTFSFRYNDNNRATNNCLLSDRRNFNDYIQAPEWDVYEVINKGTFQCSRRGSGSTFGPGFNSGSGGGTFGSGFGGGGRLDGDCYNLERSGYKFFSYRIRDTFTAIDVSDCSKQCGRSYNCQSFAYNRYSSNAENCHISDVNLRFSSLEDILSDPDWDLYSQEETFECSPTNSGGSPGECYDLERNGYRFFEVVVRDEMYSRDISECAQRCLQQQYCKSFAFRNFGLQQNQDYYLSSSADNCQLTALEVNKALSTDLISDSVWNIYGRRLNDGGFCDPDRGNNGGGGILNPSDCFRRSRQGFKLYSVIVRDSLEAQRVEECARLCRNQAFCRTFAFRQGNSFFNSGDVGVNCQLSNVSPQSLLSQDLISDPSWDVYEPDDKGQCGSGGGGTGTGGCAERIRNNYRHRTFLVRDTRNAYNLAACVAHCQRSQLCRSFSFTSGDDYDNCLLSDEAQINNFNDLDYDTSWNVYLLSNDCTNGQGPNYNCYRPIERDYNIAQRIIRDRIRVTNLRQCEDACDNSNLFNCRIFAYTTNLNSNYNCYLSDRYGTELDTGFDLIRDFDTDVYEKAFNCNNQDYYYKNSRLVTEGKCFRQRRGLVDYRLDYSNEVTKATSKEDCQTQCINAQNFQCTGFAYSDTAGTAVSTDTSYRSRNCQLSSATSLDNTGSYSRGWLVYERVSYTGPCSDSNNRINEESSLLARYDRYKVDYRVISGDVLQRKSVSNAQQCARACDAYRSIRECQAFAFTSRSTLNNCWLASVQNTNMDDIIERTYGWDTWLYSGIIFPDSTSAQLNNELYSVGGRACLDRRMMDPDARYWYCRTNTNDWDYACRPGSTCGYSDGYNFSWCYVGEAGYDQWRPCTFEAIKGWKSSIQSPRQGRALPALSLKNQAPDIKNHTLPFSNLPNEYIEVAFTKDDAIPSPTKSITFGLN